jgi:branched-chain amino acid transport system ATP-binding protein
MTMLKLDNIEVYYGNIHALKGVSLEVHEGELVSILGANGAGKTTTLMTISGIIRPRRGTVVYLDTDLGKMLPEGVVIQGIVQCPEGRRIFGTLNVMENLRMGAIRRKDPEQVKNDLEWVFSLFPILKSRIHQTGATLSGGEQQMLAIGRSLMAKPRLLMLDEPSLGLAPLVVREIFRVIQQLRQQGVTILLVEQNARQAMAIADRCYLLETGRVALSGTVAELKSNIALEQFYLGGMAK